MMLLATVGDELVRAAPGLDGACPGCEGRLVPKCGTQVVWHWAHRSNGTADCDRWSDPETEWHLAWKSLALERGCRVEVVIRDGNEWHRADIVRPDGRVVEVQHSPLGEGEAMDRDQFYGRHGGLTWIFDARERWWDNLYWRGHPDPPDIRWWQRFSFSVVGLRSPMFWDTEDGLHAVKVLWRGDYRTKLRVAAASADDVFEASALMPEEPRPAAVGWPDGINPYVTSERRAELLAIRAQRMAR